jgi:hypothetical protein
MTLLALDSRWRRFNDESRACPCCGQSFNGIFDIGYDHPDDWPHDGFHGGDPVEVGDDFLVADLCRLDGRFFIRSVLSLPLRGAEDSFSFGPWAEVSKDDFRAYADSFSGRHPFPGAEGILANALPLFEVDFGAAVTMTERDPTQRPFLTLAKGPLAEAQQNGISFDDLLDIYAASGTDIRPHLTTD